MAGKAGKAAGIAGEKPPGVSMIKTMISWADVNEVQIPCWVTFRTMRFEIRQDHIDAWRDYPDGLWALVQAAPPDAPPRWTLGAFYPTE
jgi:hypothetical protein